MDRGDDGAPFRHRFRMREVSDPFGWRQDYAQYPACVQCWSRAPFG